MTSTATLPAVHATREGWLVAALDLCRPYFLARGGAIPAGVRVSCGLPSTGAFGAKKRTVGECWPPAASADKAIEVFVSPTVADAHEVLGILAHELVHAAVGNDQGHGPAFRRLALAIGLEGKMTSTVAGAALLVTFDGWLGTLGAYPHAKLDRSMRKKQGTRMLKVVCLAPECGYTVRTTQKWLDVGLPTCCCGEEMRLADAESGTVGGGGLLDPLEDD